MDKIKCCPFCGGDGALETSWNPRRMCWFVFVKCKVCRSSGRTRTARIDPKVIGWNSEECIDAVKFWNMRYKDGNV